MTLLREMQVLLERTYGETGVNLEEFLLPPERTDLLSAMAGISAAQISHLGRVFLRVVDDNLLMGIHYDPTVIDTLEQHNPQYGLTDENILPFMVFLEELDHGVHAALKFKEGHRDITSETFVRDLELQAKVDTYLILQMYCAFFNKSKRLTPADRRWLRTCVFDTDDTSHAEPVLRQRYRESNQFGRRYVVHLDRLKPQRRTAEIRAFRALSYAQKKVRIARLDRRARARKNF